MSKPLEDIKKAITDHAAPREEARNYHWFEGVFAEDYPDDGCRFAEQDPAATNPDRPIDKGIKKEKSDLI